MSWLWPIQAVRWPQAHAVSVLLHGHTALFYSLQRLAFAARIAAACLILCAAFALATAQGALAADSRPTPDFDHLDEAATRAAACDERASQAYETGDNEQILMALNEQAKCLEVIMFGVAREFYATDAFGQDGVEARFAELRNNLAQLYSTIHSEPRTCAPNCGEVYHIWAAEAYVTSIRIMLEDMIDRLKDESPLHRP